MSEIAPGADTYERGSGQPAVSDLISNRTMLVQELNPKRAAKSEKVEVRDVPNLARAVEEFEPEADFSLNDTHLKEDGSVEVSEVTVTMKYGNDKPDPAVITDPVIRDQTIARQVIADFRPEALVGKVQRDGKSELECRLLLRQRLQSQVMEQLLIRLNDPEFAAAISDAQKREAILKAIDQQIEKTMNRIRVYEVREAAKGH
jgi:hypothetical protein